MHEFGDTRRSAIFIVDGPRDMPLSNTESMRSRGDLMDQVGAAQKTRHVIMFAPAGEEG